MRSASQIVVEERRAAGWGPLTEAAAAFDAGLVAWDADGRVTRWSPRAAALTGLASVKVVGLPVAQAFPKAFPKVEAAKAGEWTRVSEELEVLRLSAPGLPEPGVLIRRVPDDARRLQEAEARAATARQQLGDSEHRFAEVFEHSPVAKAVFGLRDAERGRVAVANEAFCELLGYSQEQLSALEPGALSVDESAEQVEKRLDLLVSGEVTRAARELVLRRADGSTVVVAAYTSVISDEQGPVNAVIQMLDISDQRTAADRAATELDRLRATLAVQREVTAAASDRAATLALVANRAVELFAACDGAVVELLDADELVFTAVAGSLAGSEGVRLPVTGTLSGTVVATGHTAHCPNTAADTRVDRAACEKLGIGSMVVAPLHAEGAAIGALKITAHADHAFDEADEQQLALLAGSLSSALRHAADAARNSLLLAERTEALAALLASEQRFRLAFANSPLGMTLVSLEAETFGHHLQVNPAMTAITGYQADELAAMSHRDLLHPDDAVESAEFMREVTAGTADAAQAEERYVHKDGHLIWVALRLAAVRDEHGHAQYLVIQVEDITAQRAARAQLQQQATLLELIPAAVIVRELDGTILWWNGGAEALYGWHPPAAIGKSTHLLLATRFPGSMTSDDLTEILLTEQRWDGELQHLCADGRLVDVLSRQVVHHGFDDNRDAVLEINTDITAARAAERALAESEQRFRAQFAHSAVGQAVRSLDGRFVDVNPAYAQMLGRPVEELIGSVDADFFHPDDVATTQSRVASLFAGERASYTHGARLRHAAGHWIDVQVTVSLVREPDGRPKYLISVVNDVSARKAAEEARDEAAAALAERNAQLEAANQLKLDLIGMLGHEIGNPLTSILGYADDAMTSGEALSVDRLAKALEVICRQAHRIDDITREVLAMVSIDAGTMQARRQRLDVREEVQRALGAVGAQDVPVSGAAPTVLVNPGHLQQILVNLLTNAAKYGGGATGVRIESGGTGGRARIRIDDSGPGVPAEFRAQLFDRLTRADRDAQSVKGIGLGLYIVRGLVQANQGDVRYEPNPSGGSSFIVELETCPE